MKSILKNNLFKENGFVIIDLLKSKSIYKLRSVFAAISKNKNSGFYTSLNLENKKERIWSNYMIKEIIAKKIIEKLPRYTPFLGSFVIKKPGKESKLNLHLDWSITDETKNKAIGVWIPLIDINKENGSLGLLKGSHKFPTTIRGSLINFFYGKKLGKHKLKEIAKNFEAVDILVSAGQAVVYDLSMAHYSKPNLSKETRVAINLIMIPENANTFHYKLKNNAIYKIPITSTQLLDNFFGSEIIVPKICEQIKIVQIEDIEEQHLNETIISATRTINAKKERFKTNILREFIIKFTYKIKYKIFDYENK